MRSTVDAPQQPSGRHQSFVQGPAVELNADYVVVGSGAGGAAAAITLARAGRSVILCEAGPWRDPEDYPYTMYGTMRDMFNNWGSLVATGDSIIPVVQARLVGGTPIINSAIVVRTPDDVLEDWRLHHGLGDVFGAQAIGRAQDRIEQELQIQASEAAILGPSSELMLAALERLGLEGHPTLRNVAGCQGVMQCLQGCRNRAKKTSNMLWIRELLELGGNVLSCAEVSRVDHAGGVATGIAGQFVHPEDKRRGAQFRVQARRGVVLAASATGSAPLLQRSGVKLPYLGKGWRAHPGAGVLGVYDEHINMHRGPSQAAASIHYRNDIGIKLESLSLPLELIAARVGGAGPQLMQRLAEYRKTAMWVAAVRCDAVGSIHRTWWGGTALHFVPSQKDVWRLREGLKIIARLHFEVGAKKVWPGVYGMPFEITPDTIDAFDAAPLDNKAYTWVLSHLFGGCVLGKDPATSVVAPDLHVRGVRNLHVVDASAIPTTLGVNPQHTIMAMAMVAAERLANEERA